MNGEGVRAVRRYPDPLKRDAKAGRLLLRRRLDDEMRFRDIARRGDEEQVDRRHKRRQQNHDPE